MATRSPRARGTGLEVAAAGRQLVGTDLRPPRRRLIRKTPARAPGRRQHLLSLQRRHPRHRQTLSHPISEQHDPVRGHGAKVLQGTEEGTERPASLSHRRWGAARGEGHATMCRPSLPSRPIFGRNVFQRGHDESLRFVTQLEEILAKYPL